jgi:cytochrome c553
MKIVRILAMLVGAVVVLFVAVGVGSYLWASNTTTTKLTALHEVHRVDFPIPFPLSADEIAALRAERAASGRRGVDPLAGLDLDSVATARAVARGAHLTQTFYACSECHGADFGGGVMMDDPAVGTMLGPNLTLGEGSRTLAYTAADWDRMVRHGVKPDGTGSPMPADDYYRMSDRELSDVVAYIRSLPPVNKTAPPVRFGPVGKVLVATGQFTLAADKHPTQHVIDHVALPPATAPTAEFGKHLAQTCSGCHGQDLAGGPILGGPPDWPPAANLTPAGLVEWTYDDFVQAMREGVSKNGVALREPMALMQKYGKNMTDTELQALWAYLRELPATKGT